MIEHDNEHPESPISPITSLAAVVKSIHREDWIWIAWGVAVAGSFAVLERRALLRGHDTLSAAVWRADRAWPPFGGLLGFGAGGLLVHFLWTDQGLRETDEREQR
jgi:hypothetical protein